MARKFLAICLLLCRGASADGGSYPKPLEKLLHDLRADHKAQIAKAIEDALSKNIEESKRYGVSQIIVGVLRAPASVNIKQVLSQMPILEGGYFVGAIKDLRAKVEFRYQGFRPIDFIVPNSAPRALSDGRDIVYVGAIKLELLQESEKASLKGKVLLKNLEGAKATFSPELDFINHPSNGTSAREKDGWAVPTPISLNADGTFTQGGLSPALYALHFEAPGYDSQTREVTFKPGEVAEVGTIELAPHRRIALTYRVAREPKFEGVQTVSDQAETGNSWRARSEIWTAVKEGRDSSYGNTFDLTQEDGHVMARSFYGPAEIADLGKGHLADFANLDAKLLKFDYVDHYALQDGHVYLMNHKHFGYWVLMQVGLQTTSDLQLRKYRRMVAQLSPG